MTNAHEHIIHKGYKHMTKCQKKLETNITRHVVCQRNPTTYLWYFYLYLVYQLITIMSLCTLLALLQLCSKQAEK